ncbi:pseudouridine synthase, partial [Kitasatospora cineracea]
MSRPPGDAPRPRRTASGGSGSGSGSGAGRSGGRSGADKPAKPVAGRAGSGSAAGRSAAGRSGAGRAGSGRSAEQPPRRRVAEPRRTADGAPARPA